MSGLDDDSKLCSGADEVSSGKTCTSYDQKIEHCKNDGKDVMDNDDDSIKDLSSIDTDLSEENSDDTPRDNVAIISENLGKLAVSDNNDDKLFQDPPPKEDCAICMLPLPYSNNIDGFKKTYQPCCGKILCDGCKVEAVDKMRKGELKQCCPYCREGFPNSGKELIKRIKKRMKLKDGDAFYSLGCQYEGGQCGLSKDINKAIELYKQAAEFGSLEAHIFLANAYENGQGVETDFAKAMHHFEIASIRGHESARYALGWYEERVKGNMDRAVKHYVLAANCGYDDGIKAVGKAYKLGLVTKDEYATSLRYQQALVEMKSEQRTRARNYKDAIQRGIY